MKWNSIATGCLARYIFCFSSKKQQWHCEEQDNTAKNIMQLPKSEWYYQGEFEVWSLMKSSLSDFSQAIKENEEELNIYMGW